MGGGGAGGGSEGEAGSYLQASGQLGLPSGPGALTPPPRSPWGLEFSYVWGGQPLAGSQK